MSGICGIVSFGAAPPPDEATLRRVTAALEKRGPDGTSHWVRDGVALGHTRLVTTPEAREEIMPLVHAESGCVITADIRLDNREDLARRLSIDLGGRVIGDAELVLAAWLRWGEVCPEHLLGDFAFAIWDPRKRLLFAARGQMGMKQLIYGRAGSSRLIFASAPKAVRRVAPDAFPLNEARIADYLEDMEGIDRTSTFFQGILRLPPAHRLVFDAKGLRVSRYWRLEMPAERAGLAASDHEDAFLEAFTEAVRARMRSAGPVGAMMSGGMDSGSIVATASRLMAQAGAGPLKSYSIVSPTIDGCPETEAVEVMMAVPGIDPTRIRRDGPEDALQTLLEAMRSSEEPFDSTMTLLRAVYGAAQADGLRVVLDGAAGDTVFSEGDVHARLLAQGRWREVLQDAAGARQFWNGFGPHPVWALASGLWRAALPERARLLRRKISSALPGPNLPGMVSAALANRVDIAARRRLFRGTGSSGHASVSPRLAAVVGANLIVGRERYDRVASEFGIEPRDPFMNLRVIGACLQTPPEFMHAKGWPKYLLRRAMQGRLPDSVRWRRDKSHLGWQFTNAVLARHPGLGAEETADLRALGVHEDALSVVADRQATASLARNHLVYLALWSRTSFVEPDLTVPFS